MKAVSLLEFGAPEVMQLADQAVPVPRAGQVLIQVHATSVNRPDIVQRQGNYPAPEGDSPVLGLEVAGVVAQVGDAASGPRVGDRVAALVGGGGYAEYAVAEADHCLALPPSISFAEGACLCETYITAHLNVLELGRLADGESVLLHGGGGGVNTAAIQLCRALRPSSDVYVTASPGKIERVAELGATQVIDYLKDDFAKVIKSVSDGRGVDVVLDHIGADYLQQNMKSLAVAGRLVIIGVTSGIKQELNLALLMVKRQQILGSVLRSRPKAEKSRIIKRYSDDVMPLLEADELRPVISAVLPLEEVVQAHHMMENSEHFGKIVLSVRH